ncbi:MAG: amino acid permease [Candidatus Cloacimonetes bacterium]|jgi:amino acid transporter|nr:amino acid permease [Candidatus Cloacimonadota bacterium]
MENKINVDENSKPTVEKFGTFLGVYTPSVLTILGLIMYLRFGWVLGNVGLGFTFLIVVLASSITFITALSASAIATNMRVGVGGEYYMISRSLGLELGGAIGIPLYLCRTLSITFYSFGLAEAIMMFWPATLGIIPVHMIQIITAVIIVGITILSGKSAGLVLKLQIPIIIAVGISILALLIGALAGSSQAPEMTATFRTAPKGFWYVFAVFFPAVTGFTAGIGMSGDLKDPRKSIPKGTLLAVSTGLLIYLFIPLILAFTGKISPEGLASSGVETWSKIAIFGSLLIAPGIFGAILSSAFGSVLGGPRVLQSLAQDRLAPSFLAKLSKTGQPTISTWISGAIALIAVTLGDLNTVAEFVTILFLTLYVMINFSAALESLTSDASYRPKIKVHWLISLLGSFGAIAVMFLISPIACILAIAFEIILFWILRKRSMQKEWGDVRAGFWGTLARFALLKLKKHANDPRNWRPNILVFAGDLNKRLALVQLANFLNQRRGILTVCNMIIGNLKNDKINIKRETEKMDEILEQAGIQAFNEIDVVSKFESGTINITQANGIAGLNSNTIMFGWSDKKKRMISLLKTIRIISGLQKSSLLVRLNKPPGISTYARMDIWWRGKHSNGDLMLLLAHLLSLNDEWKNAKIIIHTIILREEDREFMLKNVNEMINEVRIKAEPKIIIKPQDRSVTEVIHENSRNANLVFMGLNIPKEGEEKDYVTRIEELSDGLKTTIFVRNGEEFAGEMI